MFILIYGSMVMQRRHGGKKQPHRGSDDLRSSLRSDDRKIMASDWSALHSYLYRASWRLLSSSLRIPDGRRHGLRIDHSRHEQQSDVMNAAAQAQITSAGNEFYSGLMSINFKELAICFHPLFPIGGYLLLFSIFAAVGAAVDNQEDTSQFMIPITVLMAFALYAGLYQRRQSRRPARLLVLAFPIYRSDRDDDSRTIRCAHLATYHFIGAALWFSHRNGHALRQDLSRWNTDVWQETFSPREDWEMDPIQMM